MPTIEMQMPDPPEGWEYTGELRSPGENENYQMAEGAFILRRAHQWPQWLIDSPFRWVTVDETGSAKMWASKPVHSLGAWNDNSVSMRAFYLVDVPLPSDARGESAIWQIPNGETVLPSRDSEQPSGSEKEGGL